jgi:hypothetical protein
VPPTVVIRFSLSADASTAAADFDGTTQQSQTILNSIRYSFPAICGQAARLRKLSGLTGFLFISTDYESRSAAIS